MNRAASLQPQQPPKNNIQKNNDQRRHKNITLVSPRCTSSRPVRPVSPVVPRSAPLRAVRRRPVPPPRVQHYLGPTHRDLSAMAASETVWPCVEFRNLVVGVPVISVFMILTFSELRTLGVGILVTSIFAAPAFLELRKLFVFLEIHKLVIAFRQLLPELPNLVSLCCKLVLLPR
jgi:hypothetical protein